MHPIVLAVTGASAQPLAERAIQLLLRQEFNVHLILSRGAYEVWSSEMNVKIPLEPLQQEVFWRNHLNESKGKLICHRWNHHSANIASGSYKTHAMVILPCTMGTLGRIASGYSQGLIERCADVHLKEGRKLIIAPRESPFNLIHLSNMKKLSIAGASIVPPIPGWYTKAQTLDEMIDFIVIRLFDSLDIELGSLNRWSGS